MTARTRISFGIAVLLAGTLAAGFGVPGRAGDASQEELTLDFGISEAYRMATTFSIAISDRKVLTPDQWAK